jgi:hypothetical protein
MSYDTSRHFAALAFFYSKRKNLNRHSLPAFANNRGRLDSCGTMGRDIYKRSKGQPPQQENSKGNRTTAPVLIPSAIYFSTGIYTNQS